MRRLVFILPALFGGGASGQTVVVTNLAGRTASGELVAVTAREVRLRTGRQVRTIPLRVLPEREQSRLRQLAGVPQRVDPAVAKIERDLANALARIDAREAVGALSPAEAAQLRREARAWADFNKRKQSTGAPRGADPDPLNPAKKGTPP